MLLIFFTASLWAQPHCEPASLPAVPFASAVQSPIVYSENRNCRPLEVGQGRLSDQVARQEASSIPANREYLLHRKSEKQFEVIYQLSFQAQTGADAPVTMTAADMEARVRNCLALIPPARLPDGREMTFRFVTPAQKSDLLIGVAPPVIPIKVVKASRGNADHFAEDFRCGQVIHELLHKAGLCDEYHETGGAANVGLCRPQAQGNSVMGNGMHQALDDAAGEPFSCTLTGSPDVQSYLASPTSTHKDYILKRTFRNVANRDWGAFGHQQMEPQSPKGTCCKMVGAQRRLPAAPANSSPRVRILENAPEVIRFTSTETFVMTDPLNTANLNLAVDEQNYECKIQDVEERLRPACREFLELTRPELESIADPNRTMYACPSTNPGPPLDFSVPPGSFEVVGSTINLRNKGNGRSILHSGHFERLLAGECPSPATQVYDRCSRFAYDHNYTNAQKAMSCEELLPAECKSVGWIGTLAQ